MVAGFDRYFQIAPCFRDEASRADRSPGEFYQLDFEMSYVTQDDVFETIEPVIAGCSRNSPTAARHQTAFPRIPYDQAMLEFGTDKPDLRNPIRIADVTDTMPAPASACSPASLRPAAWCARSPPPAPPRGRAASSTS